LRSSSSWSGQYGEVVTEEQVLDDEIPPRPGYGSQDGELEPQEFDHVLKHGRASSARGFAAPQDHVGPDSLATASHRSTWTHMEPGSGTRRSWWATRALL